jgi:hypothetical protein
MEYLDVGALRRTAPAPRMHSPTAKRFYNMSRPTTMSRLFRPSISSLPTHLHVPYSAHPLFVLASLTDFDCINPERCIFANHSHSPTSPHPPIYLCELICCTALCCTSFHTKTCSTPLPLYLLVLLTASNTKQSVGLITAALCTHASLGRAVCQNSLTDGVGL